jgi:hypothetical protein
VPRIASCSCGQLRLELEGDPVRVSICHCLACQQRTGSVFGVQARFAEGQVVSRRGESTAYVRTPDGGGKITFRFCPRCGATVWYENDELEGFVAVPVGAFADPSFPAPSVAIYDVRRHPWVQVPAGVEVHA